jgi:hypothetical protein
MSGYDWIPIERFNEPDYMPCLLTDGKEVWEGFWWSSMKRMHPDRHATHYMPRRR